MSSELHHYTRDEFLAEFYPDPADKAAIAAGMKQLRAEQRAFRLAEMRRRLGITQAQVAARMGITQGRVSAIEHAKPGTTELRTLAMPSVLLHTLSAFPAPETVLHLGAVVDAELLAVHSAVHDVLAGAADPAHPEEATVSQPSDALAARAAAKSAFTSLATASGVVTIVNVSSISSSMAPAISAHAPRLERVYRSAWMSPHPCTSSTGR